MLERPLHVTVNSDCKLFIQEEYDLYFFFVTVRLANVLVISISVMARQILWMFIILCNVHSLLISCVFLGFQCNIMLTIPLHIRICNRIVTLWYVFSGCFIQEKIDYFAFMHEAKEDIDDWWLPWNISNFIWFYICNEWWVLLVLFVFSLAVIVQIFYNAFKK